MTVHRYGRGYPSNHAWACRAVVVPRVCGEGKSGGTWNISASIPYPKAGRSGCGQPQSTLLLNCFHNSGYRRQDVALIPCEVNTVAYERRLLEGGIWRVWHARGATVLTLRI